MSMMLRRQMMRKAGGGLPAEYQQVAYIQAVAGTYIDSGYVPKVSPKIETRIQVMDTIDADIFGFAFNTYPSFIVDCVSKGNSWYNRWGSTTSKILSGSVGEPTDCVFWKTTTIGGVDVGVFDDTDWSSNAQSLYVGGGRGANASNVRIFTCKIYDGTALVRDMIPSYRKADNEPGMYDTVSGTFFTNAGTGEFVVGPDIVGDTTVEILEQNKILYHTTKGYYSTSKTNGGVSILYRMETPTNILHPAGIIPTSGDNSVIQRSEASLFVLDSTQTPFNHVNETTVLNGFNRWAQDESGTMTEFSNSWTLADDFYYIQFSVDTRYIDRAYMYDAESGQVWFAGVNTPYYGKANIND